MLHPSINGNIVHSFESIPAFIGTSRHIPPHPATPRRTPPPSPALGLINPGMVMGGRCMRLLPFGCGSLGTPSRRCYLSYNVVLFFCGICEASRSTASRSRSPRESGARCSFLRRPRGTLAVPLSCPAAGCPFSTFKARTRGEHLLSRHQLIFCGDRNPPRVPDRKSVV